MTIGEPATGRTRGERVRAIFAAIDSGDVDALVAMFAPDAAQRLGKRPGHRARLPFAPGMSPSSRGSQACIMR